MWSHWNKESERGKVGSLVKISEFTSGGTLKMSKTVWTPYYEQTNCTMHALISF